MVLADESGMALITVLLVTALASVMAMSMSAGLQVDIRRTANMIDSDRAWLLSRSLEEWGRQVLVRDNQHSIADHLGEEWAIGLPPTAVEGGVISGRLEDLQGRLNVNNLLDGNADIVNLTGARLTRLFEICGVEGDLLAVLADWLDRDVEIRSGGAEDDAYLGLETSYRTANQAMVSVSEFLLLEGVSHEQYLCLAPNLTALPVTTRINVNTAPAPVIRSLVDDLPESVAEEIVMDRPLNGYQDVAEFAAHPALVAAGIDSRELTIESKYFLSRGLAVLGHAEVELNTVLHREAAAVKVLGRGVGDY